jgi:hypothetical protein
MTATDWRVSITPTPRGDFQAPGGWRYNVTFHDGATPDDFHALLATLEACAPALVSAYGDTVSSTPSVPTISQPAPQQAGDGAGENIYGVGWVAEGGVFDVEIERVIATVDGKGNPTVDLYRPGNQYPFAKVSAQRFPALKALTNLDGATLKGEHKMDAPILMRFKVGKQKKNSDKHYIDFEGAPGTPPAAMFKEEDKRPSGKPDGWNVNETVDLLGAFYAKRWNTAEIADMLTRIEATPNMTTAQVVEAFKARVAEADARRMASELGGEITDPKAAA